MNFAETIASLERRIAALESNRGASLRFATVTEVKGGFARVLLGDGQGMVSAPLPTVQRRVLRDQEIKMPDIGEPVAVLFGGQGLENGVVLGACYSPAVPDPQQEPQYEYSKFSDGTELFYDRKQHKLFAHIAGDADITIMKNLKAVVKENADITAEQNVTANVKGTLSVKVDGQATLESKANIRLKAPQIIIQGNLSQEGYSGGAATSELHGGFTVREGGIAVPDNDVTAGAVSVRGHIHAHAGGSGNSGTPVGG